MTLLVTICAAIVTTILWYHKAPQDEMKIATLCYMYWGASIMWFVDAIFAYKEMGEAFFAPPIEDMVNDTFLGISAVTLGLLIWLVMILFKDPKQVFRKTLS